MRFKRKNLIKIHKKNNKTKEKISLLKIQNRCSQKQKIKKSKIKVHKNHLKAAI